MSSNKYSHISDAELLQRYLRYDDTEWLGILLQRYTLLLVGVCMKYLKNETEARDNVQQIFLKVIQEVKKYKIDYFKSWLYMVAKNHCLTVLRDKKGKIPAELTAMSQSLREEIPEDTENELSLQFLGEALEELNPEQKHCVTLFYLQKKSYQEISDITNYNILQVKSYIQNGKRNLKISIEKKIKQANSNNV